MLKTHPRTYTYNCEGIERADHFGSTYVDGRIILKLFIEKWSVKVWNGFR
jgi:hypothetical protein